MRIAYLECFAGISGDMLLGALVDVGVPLGVLTEAAAALDLGVEVKIERVDRSGISCTKVHVLEGGQPAEQHHSHDHAHAPKHSHGRSLKVICELIEATALAEPVKKTAIRAFELLGQSEAKIHNVDIEKIHFHEVGAVDAIVDIVAASAGIYHLSIDAWYCSPLNVGGGVVECAHGTFPVPAPATADLLRGYPTYSAHVEKELVTPTGAALLRVLDPAFGVQPSMRVERIGYGAGTRNPKGFPNALRFSVGDAEVGARTETVTVLETALDDLSPQVLAWVAESALAAGALDVMLTPVVMKKGRAGTLLTVLCEPKDAQALERLILRETSTLGVRVRQDQRRSLERHHVAVSTAYGEIRIKVGMLDGEVMNAAPEFEDCRAAAVRCDVPLKVVQQAAVAAYASRVSDGDKVAL